MPDPNPTEFRDVLAAWLDALKAMDTKLNAYYSTLASLENSKFSPAAPYFKDAVIEAQRDPRLAAEMKNKYDSAFRRLEPQFPESRFLEALYAWLREYQVEKNE